MMEGYGGASVTVSRTHVGIPLCFQINGTLNCLVTAQGRSLFSDSCGKQRLSSPQKFNITGNSFALSEHYLVDDL